MLKYDVKFEEKQVVLLKKYIKNPLFKELNELLNICDLNSDENNILQNIRNYICICLSAYSQEMFINAVNRFLKFLKSYFDKKEPNIKRQSPDGKPYYNTEDLLPVSNGYHIDGTLNRIENYCRISSTNGLYSFGTFIGTDGIVYLAKKSMKSKDLMVSEPVKKEVDYNSIIAQIVFEHFGEPVANYFLIRNEKYPYLIILSQRFLR